MIKTIVFTLAVACVAALPAEIPSRQLFAQQVTKEVPYHMPIDQEYHMPIDQEYHLQMNNNRVSVVELPFPLTAEQQYHLQMNNNRLNLVELPYHMNVDPKYQGSRPIIYLLLNPIPQSSFFLKPVEPSQI